MSDADAIVADIAKIPQRNIGPWAREIIEVCEASRKRRISLNQVWTAYYHTGADDENPSPYNKIKAHIDRLASYLYSPVDVRFAVGYDKSRDDNSRRMGETAASILSNHFHKRGCDLKFGNSVKWALIKGAMLNKYLWGRNGLDPHVVRPELFAVWREDIADLDQQEAFVHTQWLTPSALDRILIGNPQAKSIKEKLQSQATQGGSDDPTKQDFFKSLIIGGTQPVQTNPAATPSPAGGIVNWMDGPSVELHPEVMANLVRVDELWIQDQERQDYTTIQIAGDVVILGDIQHLNLCGLKEHHPFIKVSPNEIDGFFWGRSEIADIFLLQDKIKARLAGTQRLERLQENPPRGFIGSQGITDEKWQAANVPGGFISEESPGAKMENLAPEMPADLWSHIHEYERMFDEVTGTPPIMQGQGEPGVRAGVHADALMRTGSPRIRDRALIIERQLEDAGDLALRLLQAHDPTGYRYKEG